MRAVIGDIHGCFRSFKKLVEEELRLKKSDTLYLLGDYIDRGPRSKQVIDYIIDMQDAGYDINPIRGNHEEMFLDAYRNMSNEGLLLWIMNGAESTLESYGIEFISEQGIGVLKQLPEEHVAFMRNLPYYIMLDDYIIVHAGINYTADEPYKDFRSMVWCRDCSNDIEKSGERTIIHGHTPIPLSALEEDELKGNPQVNLDTGCVYKEFTGMGNLTAMDIDNQRLYSVVNVDF
jgi:serine/threonine protein phosphatase 1